jgi:type IV pilus assembly protein PilA
MLMRLNIMSKTTKSDEMKPEYDFSGGVRGKHYHASARHECCPSRMRETMKPITFLPTILLATLPLVTGCQIHKPEDQSRQEVLSQIQEALGLAVEAKSGVGEYRSARGGFPADNKFVGLPKPEHLIGNYVTSITVKNGAIHIALGNRADSRIKGKMLTLRPAYVKDSLVSPISWLCGYAEPVQGMAAQGENLTSVPEIFLPKVCLSYLEP